jgi:UDP-3-O-[3-hydroxymyristoyl] N-acetylglucosamine deacetylase
MRNQNTISKEISFEGSGLHSGKRSKITLKPAPENTGIVFLYNNAGLHEFIPYSPDYVTDTKNNITISNGRVIIKTVEHIASALYGLRIDNCIIEINSTETPIMDGSTKEFVRRIKECGIEKQLALKPEFVIVSPVWIKSEDKFIVILPHNGLKINYTISFPNSPIGTQNLTIEFSEKKYIDEISNARTFGFIEDLDEYYKNGLVLGANFENVHVFSKTENKVINGSRYNDEPVRHKILDLIGALALLPFDLKGYIVSYKGGHGIDVMFVKKILQLFAKKDKEQLKESFYSKNGYTYSNFLKLDDIQ